MYRKKAIIFGVSGQDGSYLSHFLLKKKYSVVGVTRNNSENNLVRLKKLGVFNKVKIVKGEASNHKFCSKHINSTIDEIYFLSGYSSVVGSFLNPYLSLESNVSGLINILEIIKKKKLKIKLFNAGSGQFFGDNKKNSYNIHSKIEPKSPYGISKAAAFWLTQTYRKNFDIFCCTGILFNHESPLRSKEFVTKKIVDTALRIKKNKKIILQLGDVNIFRDWGWAPDYVEAMWLILQRKKPQDFIIGSGNVYSLKNFVNEVFKYLDISKKNLKTNVKRYKRKIDLKGYKANINETKKILKWKPKLKFRTIIHKMINDELF